MLVETKFPVYRKRGKRKLLCVRFCCDFCKCVYDTFEFIAVKHGSLTCRDCHAREIYNPSQKRLRERASVILMKNAITKDKTRAIVKTFVKNNPVVLQKTITKRTKI